jgi:hypothetical protein
LVAHFGLYFEFITVFTKFGATASSQISYRSK